MAHKTLTVSKEAYNALARAKGKDESLTKVILRLTQRKASRNLLEKRGKTRLIGRRLKPSVKLSDIAGSGPISTEQWLKTRKVLRSSEDLAKGS